ncbi:hypothetical protein V6N11_048499 [Hibiscus sabdariffa]|uniref:Uncharacterized protein n=1 Tax=Hibiscus sabdariffa TaxID=183260 RepID=A0ABR2PVX8_9ROSI
MIFNVDVQETGAVSLGDGDQMNIASNYMDALRSSSIEDQNYEIESEPDYYYMDPRNTIESESEIDSGNLPSTGRGGGDCPFQFPSVYPCLQVPIVDLDANLAEEWTPDQSTSNQKVSCTTFNEQIGNGSPINSLTSPPFEHMTISFNPIDGFETSKLRLQFLDGNHYQESTRDIFSALQLVPVPAFHVHDVASDSNDDTFRR